ncbi:hypothetical protein SELMODRAFT_410323 [Selaginella moellendorffii]|uniref:Brf1 TBP-binding domain-containing protein n=1 Tax=Selaginella moellendorffii TaxID=88036 RepID=D8REE0_SELML|nr:hypothetical protein SELMODRAFT_410323 [Selaginella moellendorffii]
MSLDTRIYASHCLLQKQAASAAENEANHAPAPPIHLLISETNHVKVWKSVVNSFTNDFGFLNVSLPLHLKPSIFGCVQARKSRKVAEKKPPAEPAAEAARQMLEAKKLGSRVNFDVLHKLFDRDPRAGPLRRKLPSRHENLMNTKEDGTAINPMDYQGSGREDDRKMGTKKEKRKSIWKKKIAREDSMRSRKKKSSMETKAGSAASGDQLGQIVKADGIRGLYRGFGMSVITYSPTSGVWWASYGTSQRVFWRALGYTEETHKIPSQSEMVLVQAAGGLVAAACASALTAPFDTIKTRLQVLSSEGNPTVVGTARQLLQDDGWKGLYRGLVPRFLSMTLWGSAMIISYEYLKRLSVKKDDPIMST